MNDALRQLNLQLESFCDEAVEFQKMITALPALSPENGGDGEWGKAQSVATYLRKQGFKYIRQIDAPDARTRSGKRPNLLVTVPGQTKDKLWIMSHLDVVPPGEARLWYNDPWQVEIKNGKLYGRGVEDNQQGMTSSIMAAHAFLETGISPHRTICLLLCADEESGSAYGLDYILRQEAELFAATDLILVPDAGQSDSRMIEVAEKTVLWLKFKVTGKQCHASMPQDGNNTLRAASELILALESLSQKFNKKNQVFVPAISTFEPTRCEGNVPNINTIPGENIFYTDFRILPCYSVAEIKQEVGKICESVAKKRDVEIKFSEEMLLESAPPTSEKAQVVIKLRSAIREVYGVEAEAMGIGGATVAASFRRLGLPAAVWCTMEQTAHQPNESCVIENMLNDAKVFMRLALCE